MSLERFESAEAPATVRAAILARASDWRESSIPPSLREAGVNTIVVKEIGDTLFVAGQFVRFAPTYIPSPPGFAYACHLTAGNDGGTRMECVLRPRPLTLEPGVTLVYCIFGALAVLPVALPLFPLGRLAVLAMGVLSLRSLLTGRIWLSDTGRDAAGLREWIESCGLQAVDSFSRSTTREST